MFFAWFTPSHIVKKRSNRLLETVDPVWSPPFETVTFFRSKYIAKPLQTRLSGSLTTTKLLKNFPLMRRTYSFSPKKNEFWYLYLSFQMIFDRYLTQSVIILTEALCRSFQRHIFRSHPTEHPGNPAVRKYSWPLPCNYRYLAWHMLVQILHDIWIEAPCSPLGRDFRYTPTNYRDSSTLKNISNFFISSGW